MFMIIMPRQQLPIRSRQIMTACMHCSVEIFLSTSSIIVRQGYAVVRYDRLVYDVILPAAPG